MADLVPVYAALQKADAAGDTAGAKQLADYIRAQGTAPQATAEPPPNPATGGDTLQLGPLDTHIPIGQGVQNFLAGAGKATADLGRGAGQYLGLVNRQDVAESRRLDAPLMSTGAGKVGNVVGNVVDTLPAMAIPGANTIAGAGAVGAVMGALQPSVSTGETLRNLAVGGVLGAGGQAVGNAVAAGAKRILAGRVQSAVDATATNSVRDAVLQEGRQAGYVVPPTEVNPSAAATALESISGKAATKQGAQAVNQKVTNSLVATDLGLPKTAPITQQALADVRAKAGQIYAQIKQVGQIATDSQYLDDLAKLTNVPEEVAKEFPGATTAAAEKIDTLVNSLSQDKFSAAGAIEYSKRLRQQASANFAEAAVSKSADTRAIAQAQSQGANALEEMIGRHLEVSGNTDLLPAFQQARTTIAKSYQAEAALKGGNVNAQRLAAQLQKGKPMSDGFGLVARFADHFGDATKLPKGGVGVSKLAATVGGSGALYALATGNIPLAAAAAAGTAAPYAVRQGLLSGAGQRLLATPNYAPGLLGTAALQSLRQAPNAVLPATAATLPLIQSGQ
jgi:hypothetical protein